MTESQSVKGHVNLKNFFLLNKNVSSSANGNARIVVRTKFQNFVAVTSTWQSTFKSHIYRALDISHGSA